MYDQPDYEDLETDSSKSQLYSSYGQLSEAVGKGFFADILTTGLTFFGYTSLALWRAAWAGDVVSTRAALDAGAYAFEAAPTGWSVLHRACACKNPDAADVVKLLVERGANPMARDQYARTPIHVAAAVGNAAVVKALLTLPPKKREREMGEPSFTSLPKVSLTPKNVRGSESPLATGSSSESDERVSISKIMSERKLRAVFPDTSDGFGRTPMHWAAISGSVDCVKTLIDLGNVEFELRDLWGMTPLHYAAAADAEGVVEELVAVRSARTDVLNNYCETPLVVARRRGNLLPKIIGLLSSNH